MRIQRTRKIAATFLAAVILIVGIVPTFLPSGAGTENTGDSKLLFTKKLEIVNSNKYATTADVEEEGNSGFTASKRFTLTDSNYYKRGANFFLFRDVSAGIDFSEVGNKGSYVFWLKTPHSVTLTVDIQLADFSAAARFKITTTDETDWQKVTIAQSDITLLDDKFDFMKWCFGICIGAYCVANLMNIENIIVSRNLTRESIRSIDYNYLSNIASEDSYIILEDKLQDQNIDLKEETAIENILINIKKNEKTLSWQEFNISKMRIQKRRTNIQ